MKTKSFLSLVAMAVLPGMASAQSFLVDPSNTSNHAVDVAAGGKVGVGGISDPQYKLHVAGNIAVTELNHFIARYQNSSAEFSSSMDWTSVQLGNNGANYLIAGRSRPGGYFQFITNNTTDFDYGVGHNGIEVMRLTAEGNVGIGTPSPETSLHVIGNQPNGPIAIFKQSDGSNLGRLVIDSPADNASRPSLLTLRRGGVDRWSVGGIYGSDSFGIGTASPVADQKFVVQTNGNIGIGTPTPMAKLDVAGTIKCQVLDLSGADLAEKFDIAGEVVPGTVVCADPEREGRLCVAAREYDESVIGVVGGAGGISAGLLLHQPGVADGAHAVAMVGRAYVLADASFGEIKPGTALTTSSTPGHAMRATDKSRATGAILGTALGTLKEGHGLVLVAIQRR